MTRINASSYFSKYSFQYVAPEQQARTTTKTDEVTIGYVRNNGTGAGGQLSVRMGKNIAEAIGCYGPDVRVKLLVDERGAFGLQESPHLAGTFRVAPGGGGSWGKANNPATVSIDIALSVLSQFPELAQRIGQIPSKTRIDVLHEVDEPNACVWVEFPWVTDGSAGGGGVVEAATAPEPLLPHMNGHRTPVRPSPRPLRTRM